MSSTEASLDPQRFLRIHRSCMVNLERVGENEPWAKDLRVAVLTDGTQRPLSRVGYRRFKALRNERA